MFHLLVSAAAAQEGPAVDWRPLVEVRPRYTITPAPTDLGEATLRSRLGLGVSRGALSARVVFQDLRGWDEDGALDLKGGTGPALFEGWARLAAPDVDTIGYAITVGRAPVVLDSGRIVGGDDFTLAARTVDAVRVELLAHPFGVEYLNLRQLGVDLVPFSAGMNVFRFHGGHDNAATSWASDALLVLDLREDTVLTTGAYGRLDTGRLRTRLEGYVQLEDRLALLVSGSAGWVFGSNEGLILHARADMATGDGYVFTTFDAPFGDTWPWFGIAGVVGPDDVAGTLDTSLHLELRPAPQLHLQLSAHHFLGVAQPYSRGWEGDLQLRWWPSPFGSLGAGVSGVTGGIGDGIGAYVELDVRF